MDNQDLKKYLINRYRQSIEERYVHADIIQRFEVEHQFDEEFVLHVKDYFLQYIYPEANEREKLENAFTGLSSFIHNPTKIFKLLGNMTGAMFKFGVLFPLAIKSSVIALQSFLEAKKFEHNMVQSAHELNLEIPMVDKVFYSCLNNIERKDIEKFIDNVQELFLALTHTELIGKTIEIMDSVVAKMKKDATYTPTEIEGLEFGTQILKHGYDIFKNYSEADKKKIVEIIVKNEHWFVDQIFES